MQRAGNLLRHLLKSYGLESGLTIQQIKKQWAGYVGETIAAHTSPESIKGKTIFVVVDTPQWMHHLGFFKQEILEKLRHYKLEEIRFRIGKIDENLGKEKDAVNVSKLTEEDALYIEDTIGSLKDNDLKEKFRHFLSNALRHKKK
ncbi:MAG: DUF721 domain-containing protein [Nitrospirae bacterium]|nr:DUF721 domain-containing protein [Nitrospirota bacterium]